MCGIYGRVEGAGRPIDHDRVIQATRLLSHRGPDGEGFHFSAGVALGHRRLSIIDVDGGKQPIANEDETIWATYNGEIYNFPSLKNELESCGHVFRTNCDAEIIVHAYEEWGCDFVERLVGMFAFGLVDEREKVLVLGRDRFGVKPLYYAINGESIVFASEIKAIVIDSSVDWTIDHEALADYFDLGYVSAPRTIYSQVRRLEPSTLLRVQLGSPLRTTIQKYYEVPPAGQFAALSDSEALDQLEERFHKAVECHMISDVPIGAFLSGGLDSASLVAMMTAVSADPVRTFTIDFEEQQFSEGLAAKAIAAHLGTVHREFLVRADAESVMPKLVRAFDEPFADASAIPTYYVCKNAAAEVKVALSGEGGDELFAGYQRYLILKRREILDFVSGKHRKAARKFLDRIWPDKAPGRAIVDNLDLDPCERYARLFQNMYGGLDWDAAISGNANELMLLGHAGLDRVKEVCGRASGTSLDQFQRTDLATYLPGDVLNKTDTTSMLHSLEVRVPFLDHRLVEFVLGLRTEHRLKNGTTKRILRQLMRTRLPAATLARGKQGFGAPIRIWLARELKHITRHYLIESQRKSGILDARYLKWMVEENERTGGRSPHCGRLWWLLAFEMWFQDAFASKGL